MSLSDADTGTAPGADIDRRIARRLKSLRAGRGWTLEDLARQSSVPRATLSRLENAEVSASAQVLGKLCAAYGVTLSRLMHQVEGDFPPVVRRRDQLVWSDPATGFRRRSISPPAPALAGEVLECELPPATRLTYERPPRDGLEHHLAMLDGRLAVSVGDVTHDLGPADCLRYRLFGRSAFETPADSGARYILVLL